MAIQVKRIQTLQVDLQTKPGALSAVLEAFRAGGVNVISSWAYEMGPGQAHGIFYASDPAKARKALEGLGLKANEGNACWAEGDDKVGVYADLLKKIAAAGVNLGATDAFGVGGRFATVFFVDKAEDFPALCKALGC